MIKPSVSGRLAELTPREYEAESHINVGEDLLLQKLRQEYVFPRYDIQPLSGVPNRVRIPGA